MVIVVTMEWLQRRTSFPWDKIILSKAHGMGFQHSARGIFHEFDEMCLHAVL